MFYKTAILLFANLPEFEARAKSFSAYSSQKTTQRISVLLTKHFYKLSKQANADTLLIDTLHQKGKNFAERISNAFADVYAKGYENIVCIGNDCLALTLEELNNAIVNTESGKVVLGPTLDGGAYLIGIPKVNFNQLAFAQIKWQSKRTYQELKNLYLSPHAEILEIDWLADIDSEKGFQQMDSANTLINIIAHLINDFKLIFNQKINKIASEFIKIDGLSLKSPPLFQS